MFSIPFEAFNMENTIEYQQGYNDYPNSEIYEKCQYLEMGKLFPDKRTSRYICGWNAAKEDYYKNKNKKLMSEFLDAVYKK